MKLIKIENKGKLDSFLKDNKHADFLQSWEWGKFQEKEENKIIRIGVEKEEKLLAYATLVKKNIGAGKSYFYSPRGPIFDESRISNFEFQMKDIEEFYLMKLKILRKRIKEYFYVLSHNSQFTIQNLKFKDLLICNQEKP